VIETVKGKSEKKQTSAMSATSKGLVLDYAPSLESTNVVTIASSYQLYINGKWVKPQSGKYFETVNPATNEKLSEISEANDIDVDKAVKAARVAYEKTWSKLSGKERGRYLFRIARLIQERAREFAPGRSCSREVVEESARNFSS
jgi:aldehyde dehydrogenase (NAD+)